jgi:cytochrome c-type biogenesis protein CcmH
MPRRFSICLAAAVLLTAALATGVPSFAAAPQRASLPDIEDEVMCPTCGVPLNLAFSPQAERERSFIRNQITAGKTKAQIKQALVSEFGPDVLATPRHSGFDLTAYLVPVLAVVIAAIALGFGLVRWRRRTAGPSAVPAPQLSPAESARLEQDLSSYDL